MNKFEKELHENGLKRIDSKLTNACELRIELQKMYLNGKNETEAYKELNKKYYYALMDWANDYVISHFMKQTNNYITSQKRRVVAVVGLVTYGT